MKKDENELMNWINENRPKGLAAFVSFLAEKYQQEGISEKGSFYYHLFVIFNDALKHANRKKGCKISEIIETDAHMRFGIKEIIKEAENLIKNGVNGEPIDDYVIDWEVEE